MCVHQRMCTTFWDGLVGRKKLDVSKFKGGIYFYFFYAMSFYQAIEESYVKSWFRPLPTPNVKGDVLN